MPTPSHDARTRAQRRLPVRKLPIRRNACSHPTGKALHLLVPAPKVCPPVWWLLVRAVVFGGAVGGTVGDEAADRFASAVDAVDLILDVLEVGWRDTAVGSRFVELDSDSDGESGIAFDTEAVDFGERSFEGAVADDGIFDVAGFRAHLGGWGRVFRT